MSDNLRLPVLSRLSALRAAGEPVEAPPSGPSLLGLPGGDEKLMQIGDLARECGKTVRAIHLYEELALLQPAARSKGRYRLYSTEALLRIRWIGKLQEMGFSLADIQTVVKDWEQQKSAPGAMVRMREVYRKKLEETREQARRLVALERELEASLGYLDACEVCDPERLLTACTHCDQPHCADHAPELVSGFHAHAH